MISYDELVQLGTIETSPLPFAARVREMRGYGREWVASAVGKEHAATALAPIEKMLMSLLLSSRPGEYGYFSSSFGNDIEKEAVITSFVVDGFLQSDMGVKPLVISIRDFYEFMPGYPSFIQKTLMVNEIEKEKFGGPRHALIISGFSDFEIFSDKVLAQVPNREALNLSDDRFVLRKFPGLGRFRKSLFQFMYQDMGHFMEKENSLEKAFVKFIECSQGQPTEVMENLKILLAASLLLQDGQSWQNLKYRGSETGGVPLYIVAPTCFHNAMNRANGSWWHGAMDYRERARGRGTAYAEPAFEIENGQILVGEAVYEKAKERWDNQGMSSEGVLARLDPILRQLEKAFSLNSPGNQPGGLIL